MSAAMYEEYEDEPIGVDSDVIVVDTNICEADVVMYIYKRRKNNEIEPLSISVGEMFSWSVRPYSNKEAYLKRDEERKKAWREVWGRMETVIEYYTHEDHYREQLEIGLLIDFIRRELNTDMADYMMFRIMSAIAKPSLSLMSTLTNYCMQLGHFQKISKYVGDHGGRVFIRRVAAESKDNEYYVKKISSDQKYITPEYYQSYYHAERQQ